MKTGQKKRLLGGIKKTTTLWAKWYDTIREDEKLQSNKDVTVQCTDFCEVTTTDVRAVLRHAPADLRGGTLLQHLRVLVATVAYQENPHLCLRILHAAKFQVFRDAYILLRVLADTESQEAQGLLEEIRRQSSVCSEWPCNRDYQCRNRQCVLSQGVVNRICEPCRKNCEDSTRNT